MKKFILFVICLVFLSGCDVDYNLVITENGISENTKVFTDTNSYEEYDGRSLSSFFDLYSEHYEPIYFNDENYDYYLGGYQPNVRYYSLNNYVKDNYKGIELQNVFSFSDFYRSDMVKQCFDELNIQNSYEIYLIRTSNKCKLFSSYSLLNQIKITITTNLEIIYNNADSVNGNTYTWIINKDNYTNKSVRLSLVNSTKKAKDDDEGNNDEVIDDENVGNKDNNNQKDDNINKDNKDNKDSKNDDSNNTVIIAVVIIIFCGGLFLIILLKSILNK